MSIGAIDGKFLAVIRTFETQRYGL
jgi:hypothetical protein